jgi:hypothetical protein
MVSAFIPFFQLTVALNVCFFVYQHWLLWHLLLCHSLVLLAPYAASVLIAEQALSKQPFYLISFFIYLYRLPPSNAKQPEIMLNVSFLTSTKTLFAL